MQSYTQLTGTEKALVHKMVRFAWRNSFGSLESALQDLGSASQHIRQPLRLVAEQLLTALSQGQISWQDIEAKK